MKKSLFLSLLLILPLAVAEARLTTLSPWSFQDRLPTPAGKFDQAAEFQVGLNGVTPAGGDTDAKFINVPAYQLTYGVIDKLEVGGGWGLEWVDRRNRSSQFGVTDMMLGGRYRFFDADRQARIPGLDVEMAFVLPTGSFDKGLGTGAFGVQFGWGLVLPLDPARAIFSLGYRLNTENSDDVKVGNVFSYSLGASIPWNSLPNIQRSSENILLTGEIKGFNHARNKFKGDDAGQPAPDELYLSPGAIWEMNPRMNLASSLLIGLTTDSSDLGFNLELRF